MWTKMTSELFDEIKCPICLEIPQTEIFQCSNGHSYCDICSVNIEECPLCRKPFTGIRNRALESLLDKIKFDCANKTFGCGVTTHRTQISAHRRYCTYK